jgi:hypothetical protein
MTKTLDVSAVTTVTCAYRSELVFKCQRHDKEIAQGNALGKRHNEKAQTTRPEGAAPIARDSARLPIQSRPAP